MVAAKMLRLQEAEVAQTQSLCETGVFNHNEVKHAHTAAGLALS